MTKTRGSWLVARGFIVRLLLALLPIAYCLLPSPAWGAANTIAQAPAVATATGTTINKVFAGATVVGSRLIAVLTVEGVVTSLTVADNGNAGNYTQDVTGNSGGGSVGARASYIFSKVNTVTSAVTITATWTGASAAQIQIYELRNIGGTPIIDVTANGGGTSGAPVVNPSVSITTTTASDTIIVGATSYPPPATPDTGFVFRGGPTALTNAVHTVEDRVDAAAAGATTLTLSGLVLGGGNSYSMAVAAYKPPAVADVTPPTVPGSLSVTPFSTTQNNLSWTASTDDVAIAWYSLEHCTGAGCVNFVEFNTSGTTAGSDTGLQPSTLYRYRIRAFDGTNYSAYSTIVEATTLTPDATAPTVPTNVLATVVSTTQINLAWTASTDNIAVTNYRVERCTGAACVNFSEVGAPTAITFPNTALTAGTVYRFRVRAFDGVNFSAYSTIIQATTLLARQATIRWTDTVNTDHTGYTVQRKTGVGGTFADLGSVGPSLRQLIDPDSPSPIACYRVRAVRAGEDGPQSGEACTTTSTPTPPINLVLGGKIAFGGANTTRIESRDNTAPSVPTNLVANVVSSTEIDLAWTASTDNLAVINYRVERCAGNTCINFVEIATPSGLTLADTGLQSNTFYNYRVRAWDGTLFSTYSAIAPARTDTQAATTLVKKSGADTVPNCTNSTGVLTVLYALENCVGGGVGTGAAKVVEVESGTYDARIDEATGFTYPSGTSNSRFILRAKAGHAVVLKATGHDNIIRVCGRRSYFADIGPGFTFDGTGHTGNGQSMISPGCADDSPSDIKIVGNNIINGGVNTGVAAGQWSSRIDVIGNTFSGWTVALGCFAGNPPNCGYPMYFTASDSEISGNTFTDFAAYGIHIYLESIHPGGGGAFPSRNLVKNNVFSGPWGSLQGAAAILIARGDSNVVANNTIRDGYRGNCAGAATGGVVVDFGATNTKALNNSVFNSCTGMSSYNAQNSTFSNNALYGNNLDFEVDPVGRDSGRITSNNGCSQLLTGCNALLNEASAAVWTDAPGGVLTLKSTAKATTIGGGIELSALSPSITTDIVSTSRSAPYSVGAYQFSSGTCPATPIQMIKLGFDEGTGTTAADSSGNGNNVVSIGSGNSWNATGKYGKALTFGGTAAATVADSISLFPCTAWTYMAWVKPTNTPTDFAGIINKGVKQRMYSASHPFYVMNSGQLAGWSQGADVFATWPVAFTAGTYVHYTVTYNSALPSANVKIRINGAIVASADGTTILGSTTDPLLIGGSLFGEYFVGDIDEVKGWNSELTGAQIITEMNTPIN